MSDPVQLGIGLARLARTAFPELKVADLEPCNTRIIKRKATPRSWFRSVKCAVHRLANGKWEMNTIDPL